MLGTSNKKISEINKLIKDVDVNEDFLNELANDPRTGVQKIYNKLLKENDKEIKEFERLKSLCLYEDEFHKQGYNLIAGIDEAGRGPIAGPVLAGAVIFPDKVEILDINDSKKLSAKKREQLVIQIKETAICWSIGMATEEEIHNLNIRNATHLAMLRAGKNLDVKPNIFLVDGFIIPGLHFPQKAIVGGDAKSISIAAASIIAKVERDKIMDSYHEMYPQYGFNKHKGYGTKDHFNAILKYGPCPIHRKGFEPVKSLLENQNCLFKDFI